MQTSEQINELVTALAKAQAAYKPIGKDKTAKTPQFSYSYADYATVLDAIRPALNANGIAIIQGAETSGASAVITTRLCHSSGQWVESKMTVTAESAAVQKLGSAITYARRYSFLALVGAAPTEEDDDGAAAMPMSPARKAEFKAALSKPLPPVEEEDHPQYPPEAAGNAGDAMRKVIGKLRAASPKKGPAPARKADALAYIAGKVGKDQLREKVEAILGRKFPEDFADDMLISLQELEKLESWVVDAEAADLERHGSQD